MLKETVALDDKKVIVRKYKLRTAGARGATIEITLPKHAVEREARRLGLSEEDAVERMMGVWRYNSFSGLHLDFELKENVSKDQGKVVTGPSVVDGRTQEKHE